ncbi:MAG: hypothetical protein ACHQ17_13950 [Polyangia bacterium]|jgi:hypothetical protein
MPRPRKNDPTPLIRPILADFARALGAAVERNTLDRVRAALDGARTSTGRISSGRRSKILCYYPGCKNLAAPRFGMFCAAEHKKLPAAEKEKYKKQHAAKQS